MIRKCRKYLLRGILILLPVGATFILCWKTYQLLDSLVLVYIHRLLDLFGVPRFPLLDLAALVLLIFLVGLFGGNFIGRNVVRLVNFFINKIPLIRVIYAAIQQILESIFREDKRDFSKVGLVEYPRKGIYSLVFITSDTKGAVKNALGEDTWSVFLPTTPNPTSGFLLFVPKKDTKVLNISIDQAAKLVMSAGVIDEKQSLNSQPEINVQKLGNLFKWKLK